MVAKNRNAKLTISLEEIDGHLYEVHRNEAGQIVSKLGRDPIPEIPSQVSIQQLLNKETLTPEEQTELLQAIGRRVLTS